MKLLSFRVRKFRNIVDSGEVTVDSSVTSIVGKNEAGKSALLEALYLLNPIHKEKLVLQDQYPRWLLTKDRRNTSLEEHAPITATFQLQDKDIQAAEKIYGTGILKSLKITVLRRYDGELKWSLSCDEPSVVHNLISSLAEPVKPKFSGATTLKEFRQTLKTLKDNALSSDELEMIAERLGTDSDFDEASPRTEDLEKISDQLHTLGLENGALSDGVGRNLAKLLPQFFLFTQYSTLPGRINLTELAYGNKDKSDIPEIQTAQSLIRLTGTDVKQLRNENYELRRSELEAVGIDLTAQVFKYWKQNPHLEVSIDVDKINVQHGDKSIAVPRYMEIRLRDKRTGYSNNFRQRSSGFQWFFSFLAAFSEFNEEDAPIVLLDEPAVRLHGKTQEDFLSFIHEKLAVASQVLYSTHSPFMIETSGLERVRIVEDLGPPEGAVVSPGLQSGSSESAFPLRTAVAHDIAQNMFSGQNNLLVESLSDYLYLTVMSSLCEEAKREPLDSRWQVTPIGNATGFPILANLTDSLCSTTVLCGVNTNCLNGVSPQVSQELLQECNILRPGTNLADKDAELEDLFTDGDYIKLVNQALGGKLKAGNLNKRGQISKRIEKLTKEPLNRLQVARTFLRTQHEVRLTKTTLDRFETLINEINSTISSEV